MAPGTSDSREPARVLLVLYTFHPNLEGLILGLAQANHPVRVLVMEQTRVQIGAVGPEGTRTVSESFASRASSAIRRVLKRRRLHMWEKTPSFTGMWREFREYKPGIVIVRSNQLGILGSFVLARLMRAKFVVYNLRPLEWPPQRPRVQFASAVMRALRIRPVPRMTPVSPHCKARHEGAPFSSWWVPFSVGYDESPAGSRHASRDEVRLVFVGSISRIKRLERVFDALQTFVKSGRGATLTIAGMEQQDSAYTEELQALAEELGISQFVRWQINVPHDEIWEIYREHDVFVSLAREIGGMAMVEAMATGMPVVVSDEIGVSSYLLIEDAAQPRGGEIVNGASPDALVEVLEQWLAVPGTIAAKGKEARALVQRHYQPTNAYQALARVLDGACAH